TYATQKLSNMYSTPVHQLTPFLPVFLDVDFEDKEKTILISNDNSLYGSTKITKGDVLDKLNRELPAYKLIEIKNLGLEDYKKLIANSLFTISFGEGFDGYFIEPILSKSLSFAVFNPYFFPSEFADSQLVYSSWDDLFDNIVDDIKTYAQDKETYENLSSKNREQIKRHYSNKKSRQELENYYKKNYDFVPGPVEYKLFGDVREKLITEQDFEFMGDEKDEKFVITPDNNIFINMRGDFYQVLEEIYGEGFYQFDIDEDFILIDIGFHAGIASTYLRTTHKNLRKIYGFEAFLPTYQYAIQNIKNNHLEKDILLKPLGLSDHFALKQIPYIPDWAANMSIEGRPDFYDMYASSEVKSEIQYVETEIVPAHSELEEIIAGSHYKIALKCNVNGTELAIIGDLDAHGLLGKIDLFEMKLSSDVREQIQNLLAKNELEITEKTPFINNNTLKITARKNNK
ncbi:MAG: hypothetical protein SCH68_02200, partial [Brevefilum sp.]|nr:hypothetical protein [Brevefilum sp.]